MWIYIALGIICNTVAIIDSESLIPSSDTFILNETVNISSMSDDEMNLSDFIYTIREPTLFLTATSDATTQVDCLGLGITIARLLQYFFLKSVEGKNALKVKFTLSSNKEPNRVKVHIGNQFGLEWTDFNMRRRTVVIVHGFLSHANEEWVFNMERAFLRWANVNVIVVDWSDAGNTWNYYKAAMNTKVVGQQIARLLEQIASASLVTWPNTTEWGQLHFVGHSLGAHICGFAAKEFKKRQRPWNIKRITGLDPAQPCFRKVNPSMRLHRTDADFVDIIHTNGRFLSKLGLGLPKELGDSDFYPNGGKVQPGCSRGNPSFFDFLPIPKRLIEEAICSHGRSYLYFIESLKYYKPESCGFWARRWNLTFDSAQKIISLPCSNRNCTQMGIQAERYPVKGVFFVPTTNSFPFCDNSSTKLSSEALQVLMAD